MTLLQVTGKTPRGRFCAGLVLNQDKVIRAAPKLYYMRAWNIQKVRDYCHARHWRVEEWDDLP